MQKNSGTSHGNDSWTAVVTALGLTLSGGDQAYGPCPVHGGNRKTAFSVGRTKDGSLLITCWTKCKDSQPEASDARRRKWFKKACKAIAKAHPEVAWALPYGDMSRGKGASSPTTETVDRTPLPSEAQLEKWCAALADGSSSVLDKTRDFLQSERGLSIETVRRFKLGVYYNRVAIPIRDGQGRLLNIRRYEPHHQGNAKVIGWKGHNEPRLFPVEVLDGDPAEVLMCESELDALVAIENGFTAVTGTGGAGSIPNDVGLLKGRSVTIAYDCDEAGRKGAVKLARALRDLDSAADVRILDLGLGEGEDITDWFVTHGRSAKKLRKLMKRADQFNGDDPNDEILWLSDVEESRLEWLWDGRLLFGKINVLEGDPGLGKSTIWCDLVSRVTTGKPFPDSNRDTALGRALIIAAEDDLSDTIVPRLRAAGADLRRCGQIPLRRDENGMLIPLSLPEDLDRIERHITRSGITLLVIDPLMAFLSEDINSHSDASVRRALTPLAEIAQTTGCAVLLVRHLNKAGDMKAMYRGGGSIAVVGAARSGLVVAEHPDDPDVKVLCQVKTNLSAPTAAITYTIEKASDDPGKADTYIEWGDSENLTADGVLGGTKSPSPERAAARDFLNLELGDGPRLVKDIKSSADAAGLSWKTIDRASHDIGVDKHPQRNDDGTTEAWVWSIGPRVTIAKGEVG
ncbi:AAA family ATPase [Aeromicrobium sp. HA]|uniref:AAA family ATPase n=1 Tax=Aeromicrobium sp. HA TaxID=3009077 RepID=UPI0022AECC12|nr:AAA family ATPase [Aeromicrobium sp. HA]